MKKIPPDALRDGIFVPPGAVRDLLWAAYKAGHVDGSRYDGELPEDMIWWDFERWTEHA